MADNFQLRPLSSGIGLGTLKPAKSKKPFYRDANKPVGLPQPKIKEDSVDISPFSIQSPENNSFKTDFQPLPKLPQSETDRVVDNIPGDLLMAETSQTPNFNRWNDSTFQNEQTNPHNFVAKGHAEYRAQSHSVILKNSASSRFLIWLAKAIVGWGLDLFVVLFTIMVSALLGSFAWRLGRGDEAQSDPVAIMTQLLDLVVRLGPAVTVGAFLTVFVLYFVAMKFMVGATIGGSLQD